MLVLSSTLALLLVLASAAGAAPGCDAPPGTAATEQYCETVPAPQGSRDVTRPSSRPLGATLPKPIADALADAGVLGEVLLAMATGTPADADDSTRDGATTPRTPAEQAEFDPRLDALSNGPADGTPATLGAAASTTARGVQIGFGAALVLTLIGLAGCSLASRRLGGHSGR